MVKGEIKNYGRSNRTKLLNLARKTKGADYNLILLRFVQERFLYRLSLSAYRDNFFLKGGALLFAHERFAARPTRDMDFLGDHISRDRENIKRIMLEICSIECEEDGVTFECGEEDIWLEDITIEQEYNGTRVHMTAHMDTIVQPFSIDVGFGDVIVPQPAHLDYPLLLEGLPAVNVEAYSLETVVAEKFQTMIDRGTINSRMKDFFDVYMILKGDKVDHELLKEAVVEVFANRGTSLDADNVVFSDNFAQDENRQTMWKAYLKRIKYKDELAFSVVMDVIRERLQPMMTEEEKSNAQILELSYDFSCRIIRLYKYLNEGKLSKADRDIVDALGRQLLRSATSINANMNEAQHPQSDADFLSKSLIALKEARESENWLRLLTDNGYLEPRASESLIKDCVRINKILISITAKVRKRLNG